MASSEPSSAAADSPGAGGPVARASGTASRAMRWRRAVLGSAVAAMGLVNVLSALLSHAPERLHALRRLVPPDVLDTSRTFTLLAGALLLVTAWGLRRGKRRAYVLALFLCAVSVPVNLLKAFDFEEATLAAALMFILGVTSDAFRVRSSEWRFRMLGVGSLWALGALALYAFAGSWLLEWQLGHHVSLIRVIEDVAYQTFGIGGPVDLVPKSLPPAAQRIAQWYANSLPILGLSMVIVISLAALQPVRHRRRHREDRARVLPLLHAFGESSVASFALDDDSDYFFSANGRAVIAYRFQSDALLAIGDPIGPPEELPSLVAEFARFCEESDWACAFFQARGEALPLYRELGWSAFHVGEDPILWTDRFTLEGSAMGDVRRSVAKAARAGMEVRHFVPDERPFDPDHADRALFDELRVISDQWLSHRQGGESGFCMGRFEAERLRQTWLAVAWNAGTQRVEGFVTWEPIWARRGWALDLMRRRDDSAHGTMELLITRSVERARERGDALLSLSLSALATVEAGAPPAPSAEATAAERHRALLRRHLARFYDFEGLFRWKSKFSPEFEDRYLVYARPSALPRLALALVRAQSATGLRAYAGALLPWKREPGGSTRASVPSAPVAGSTGGAGSTEPM